MISLASTLFTISLISQLKGVFLWGDLDQGIKISDPRSLSSWNIKGTDEYILVMDSSAPLILQNVLSDLGSLILIQISPKEHTLRFFNNILRCYLTKEAY